jgi:hypothetical protein
MMRHVLRLLALGIATVLALGAPAAADIVGPPFIPPPLGSFEGRECLDLVHDSNGAIVGVHVQFEGTFTAVPFLGAGTFLYDVAGPTGLNPWVGTWSMSNATGSIGGSAVVTAGALDEFGTGPVKLQLIMDSAADRTGIGLTIFGSIVGHGTREIGGLCGDFSFDTSGSLNSSLHRVKCKCEA